MKLIIAAIGATISNAAAAAWFLFLLWILDLIFGLSDQAWNVGWVVIAVIFVGGWLGSFRKIAS